MDKPKTPAFSVELPADLEPVYTNFALISHSPSEMIVDFSQLMPNNPKVRVKTRVVMTPLNAKLLLRALQENLTKYETTFGEIAMPGDAGDLARAFFGGLRPPGTD